MTLPKHLVIAAGIAASGCGSGRAVEARPAVIVRLATGAAGGGFYPFGQALAEQLNRRLIGIRIEPQISLGAVANLRAIQSGEADVALAFADVAYLASVGRLDRGVPPFDQVRAIAVLQLTPVQLVARAGSGIGSVRDLEGRRVAIGPEGSGTALTARLIMEAFGIHPGAVRAVSLEFRSAGLQLLQGKLDAMFDSAFYAESAANALRAGAGLVAIEGPPVTRLARKYPFLRMTVVPRDTYPGIPAVPTIGVDSLLVCRRTLDADVVRRVTEALFEQLPLLSTAQRRFVELDQAPAAPVPLHEGAARYYRQQELR